MAAAWAGICCSDPPCVCVSLRKATYSYTNIVERKAFTVNIPSDRFVKEADYVGISSGRNVEKFSVCGLTEIKSNVVDASYVEEFPLVLECKVIHIIEIGLHIEFIGEIMDIKADLSALGDSGNPDIEKIRPIIFDPANRNYYGTGRYLGDAFSIGRKLK